MPSLRPTSSFEQPSAIKPTTWSCLCVKAGGVPVMVVLMASQATRATPARVSADGSIGCG
jgi:hypothetical protein